jgi:hypothetical protein
MVKGADCATSYGLVLFLFNWTMYAPGATAGRPEALMSPRVTAKVEVEKETCTTFDSPAARSTLAKPTKRCGGTTTLLIGWAT